MILFHVLFTIILMFSFIFCGMIPNDCLLWRLQTCSSWLWFNGMPLVCYSRFCGECLQPCLQVASPLCPLCRVPFDPKKVERSSSVEKQLASFKAPCRGCSKKVEAGHRLALLSVHVCVGLTTVAVVCLFSGDSGEDEVPHCFLL